jgi:hypothetical protein
MLAIGAWRSLVAHLPGGQRVAGSNPVAPTKNSNKNQCFKVCHSNAAKIWGAFWGADLAHSTGAPWTCAHRTSFGAFDLYGAVALRLTGSDLV